MTVNFEVIDAKELQFIIGRQRVRLGDFAPLFKALEELKPGSVVRIVADAKYASKVRNNVSSHFAAHETLRVRTAYDPKAQTFYCWTESRNGDGK